MATPSPQQVGREFVRQYYTVLHEAPDVLHRFYSSGSTFVHGGVDRPDRPTEEPVVGQLEIDKKIKILNFKDCHTKIRQVDSQLTIGSGVVVQVTGELSNNGEPMRRFMQTFVLAPQTPKKFYVHNDIFRYQDEVYQDNSDTESEDQQLSENNLVSKTVNSLNNYYQQNEALQQQQPQQDDAITGQQSTSSMSSSMPILTSPTPAAEIQKQQLDEQQQQQLIEEQSDLLNGHNNASNVMTHVDEVIIQQEIKTTTVELVTNATEELALRVENVNIAVLPKEEQQTTETKINSWAKLVQSSQGDVNALTGSNNQVYQTSQFLGNNTQKSVVKEQNFNNTTANSSSNTNKPANQQQKSQVNGTRDNKQRDNANKSRNNNHQESRSQQQQQPRDSQAQQTPREPRVAAEDEKNFGRYPDGQQVFVGNLNQDLSEAELRTYFSQYGNVMDMRINTNSKQQSGRRLPNYGFVVFEEKQAVENLLAASKSNSITYKNEKGEYRLNVEEKRARQGRISSGFGGGKGGNNNRNNRSTSNGSRNGNINNNNAENQRDRPKKTNNTNNNFSSNNTQESGSGYDRREGGGFGNSDRRKTDIHDGQPIVDGGSRRNNANPRRS